METNALILSTLRKLAASQGGMEECVEGKTMCRVAPQNGVCIYGLLDDNINLEDMDHSLHFADLFELVDIAARAMNELKEQGYVHFEGSPRYGLWVTME